MIKSKIEARERALETAVSIFAKAERVTREDFFSIVKDIEKYLISDANLPEVEPSIEEITAKSIEKLISATNMQSLGAMGVIGSFDKNTKS